MTELRDVMDARWQALAREVPSGSRSLRTSPLPVETPQGPLLLALDSDGRRHLLVPLASRQTVETDATGRAVHLSMRQLESRESYGTYADLALIESSLEDVFTSLCGDVLVAVDRDPDRAPRGVRRVLRSWRALLAHATGPIGPEALAGVFAELVVLERLVRIDPGAAAHWHGPSGAAQDFHRGRHAMEVKASTAPDGRAATIHGLGQLEEPAGGSLILAWFRLSRGAGAGRSVPDAVDRVLALVDDEGLVRRGLAEVGYLETDRHLYESVRFTVREEIGYLVSSGFPRLTRAGLTGDAQLGGLSAVSYRIDLAAPAAEAHRVDDYVDLFLGGAP